MARKGKRNPRGTCPGGERNDVKIGVCGPCGRYRTLWLPAGLCERCLVAAVDTQALIAELERLAEDDALAEMFVDDMVRADAEIAAGIHGQPLDDVMAELEDADVETV